MPSLTPRQALDLAVQHRQAGRLAEAEALCHQALALAPGSADALHLLGLVLHQSGSMASAADSIRQAIAANPSAAHFHNNLGNVLQDQGSFEDAASAYRQAIVLKPDYAMAHYNLGNALFANGRLDEAILAFQQALAHQPDFAVAHNNLGNAFKKQGRLDEARGAYRRALDADPDFALALSNLAAVLHERGELDEALDFYQQAAAAPHSLASIHSSYLCALHYSPQMTPERLLEAHDAYDRRYAQPFRASWRPPAPTSDPHHPLRVGFISPHFGFHPVGYFLVRLLENLDKRELEVVCYADSSKADAMSSRLRACASAWHCVQGDSDEQLAQRIREERIDILFDLAGHTAGNRLLVFARKPAPIQITWLDYVGTTGLSAMDYILADPRQIPPGAERFYREKILRLPDDYICFEPPAAAPAVAPLPAAARGFVTFASFNTMPKTTPQVVEVWGQILRQIPRGRLILRNRGFDDPAVTARYRHLFAEQSVDQGRIDFQGWSPHAKLLAGYNAVDIALDPFPYNGGLTTCEALWMGVPVVTCPGETFASRHSLAHLTAAGVTETIARDFDDYVKIAVALATDLPKLATLRAGLRERLAASPLCDGPRFARNFETSMREVWQRWSANLTGER